MTQVDRQTMIYIAEDMVDMGLSGIETYDRVNHYYELGIDFRTKEGKAFYEELCVMADKIESGEDL